MGGGEKLALVSRQFFWPRSRLMPVSYRDSTGEAAMDVEATAVIDEQLLTALGLVNMENMRMKEEYRQVVLLGCGLDTRPFRCCPHPPTK
jgi:hypothetical protein